MVMLWLWWMGMEQLQEMLRMWQEKVICHGGSEQIACTQGAPELKITNNLQAQLAELAKLISGTTRSPHMQVSAQQDITQFPGQVGIAQEDIPRADHVEQINQIDEALNRLPDTPSMAGARASLLFEKAKCKKLIINLRPFGARLDGCR